MPLTSAAAEEIIKSVSQLCR